MAILVTEVSFCGCADVGEDKVTSSLASQAFEVDAIPGWNGRRKDTWVWPKKGRGVVPYSKAIAIVRPPAIESEA